MTLKLKDLKFGELNNIKDNNVNPSGDRRRTNTTTAIRFATEKAFEINTLAQVTQFTGFVVGSRRISRPVAEYKSSILQIQETESEEGADTEYKNYLYKVYIPELEPLPAPVSFDDPVIGLYADVALAEGVVGIGDATENLNGALVEVTYDDAENLNGPKITRLISTEVAKGLDMGDSMSLAGTFAGGSPLQIGGGNGQQGFATSPRKIKTFTWQERKVLYAALKPLFDYISKGEGNIDSLNRGVAGDTPSKYSSTVFTDGKPLSKRTIGEVQKLYKGGSMATKVSLYKKENTRGSIWKKYQDNEYTPGTMTRVKTPGITAAGKFQWVKGTMKSCIQKVGLTQNQLNTLIFNNDNQNTMGTYLILDKAGRSRLGGYLLGLHDNVADAGQELAMEFASVPNQFNAKNGLKKNWICPRGYNHYCSDPKPGAKEGANAKFKPTNKKPDGVAQKLREARDAIAKNPKAVAIARTIDTSAFT
jgi:hypothetical protein